MNPVWYCSTILRRQVCRGRICTGASGPWRPVWSCSTTLHRVRGTAGCGQGWTQRLHDEIVILPAWLPSLPDSIVILLAGLAAAVTVRGANVLRKLDSSLPKEFTCLTRSRYSPCHQLVG